MFLLHIKQALNLNKMIKLKEGDKAPNFTGSDQDGNSITLEQFMGNGIILFFYLQDCFSGCAAGCALRNNFSNWADKGFKIIGVCNNNFEEQRNFILQNSLPFTLVADPDKRIAHKYGGWGIDEKLESLLHAAFKISRGGYIEKILTDVSYNKNLNQIEFLKRLNLEYLN